jgi:hypothetical protein
MLDVVGVIAHVTIRRASLPLAPDVGLTAVVTQAGWMTSDSYGSSSLNRLLSAGATKVVDLVGGVVLVICEATASSHAPMPSTNGEPRWTTRSTGPTDALEGRADALECLTSAQERLVDALERLTGAPDRLANALERVARALERSPETPATRASALVSDAHGRATLTDARAAMDGGHAGPDASPERPVAAQRAAAKAGLEATSTP